MNFSSWMRNGVNSILSLSGPGRRTGINCLNILRQYVSLYITEEVDHATGKLGYNLTTISHKVWRQVQIIVILHPLGKVVKPHET